MADSKIAAAVKHTALEVGAERALDYASKVLKDKEQAAWLKFFVILLAIFAGAGLILFGFDEAMERKAREGKQVPAWLLEIPIFLLIFLMGTMILGLFGTLVGIGLVIWWFFNLITGTYWGVLLFVGLVIVAIYRHSFIHGHGVGWRMATLLLGSFLAFFVGLLDWGWPELGAIAAILVAASTLAGVGWYAYKTFSQ